MRIAEITRGPLARAGRQLVWWIGPIFVPAMRSRRHFVAGHRWVAAGDHQRAADAFAAGLAYKPWAFGMLIHYGCALKNAGRTDEAVAAFDRARQLDPRDAHMHEQIGHLNVMAGHHEKASEHYLLAAQERRRSLSRGGFDVLLRLVPDGARPELRRLNGEDSSFVPLVLSASRLSVAGPGTA